MIISLFNLIYRCENNFQQEEESNLSFYWLSKTIQILEVIRNELFADTIIDTQINVTLVEK